MVASHPAAEKVVAHPARPTVPWLNLQDWVDKDPPDRQWLVPGLVPDLCVTSLYGDGGSGKTMLALDLMVAMATKSGHTWLGERPLGWRSVGLFAEDDGHEIVRRLQRLCAARDVPYGDIAPMIDVLPGVGLDVTVARYADTGELVITPLMEAVIERVRQKQASLLVLDYAAAIFAGNEIDRTQVSDFMRRLNAIALSEGIAILLLGHPSMDGMKGGRGTSGSTAWRNQVRSFLHLTVDDVQDDPSERVLLTLKHAKSNYGRAGRSFSLASNGSRIEVLAEREREARKPKGPRLSGSQQVGLLALREALDNAGTPSPGGPIPIGARVVNVETWRQYAYAKGISQADNNESRKKAFQTVRSGLVAKGVVGMNEPYVWLLEAGR